MRALLVLGLVAAVFGQGTAPRERPESYPAHAQARSAAIGAEFLGRRLPGGQEAYVARGHLVVEVALFPPPGHTVDVHSGNFVLYVNGRKQELLPQPPSLVSAQPALLAAALPQFGHRSPVSGCLYFPYNGKISGIKTLELRYEDAILRLR